ncbi:MAG: hypothetical protein ACO22M_05650 [Candidatus Nanopelagicaceae bacterium]
MNEIPEIIIAPVEVPIIRKLEPPVLLPPSIRTLQKPVVEVPSANLPYYEQLDVPTMEQWKQMVEGQNTQEEKKEEEQNKDRQIPPPPPPQIPAVQTPEPSQQQVVTPPPTTDLGVPVIEVPLIGEVPIPPKEQVLLAGTTATASVAAAIVGKSLVEWMVKKMKPIVQQLYVQAKKRLHRDLTPYELQVDFAAQLDLKKKIVKAFQKELKLQKKEQYLHWAQQQRLHTPSHTETEDGSGFLPSWLPRIVRGERVRSRGVPYQSPPSGD